MRWYRNSRVFITGGSSGIGKATAILLAGAGARVVIAARGVDRLERTVDEIRTLGLPGTVAGLPLDIADRRQVEEVAAQVLASMGGLDVLINNAGIVRAGRIEDLPDRVFDDLLAVNYRGTVNVTRAFLHHFQGQRRGRVCNVGSLLGFLGVFGYSAYAASKFAVTGFTDCLRQELLPYGVKVTLVFPPNTDTPQLVADREHLPPETHAITARAGILSAETVARAMLAGIARGSYHVLPGFGAGMTWAATRHIPRILRWAIDRDLMKACKATGCGKAPRPAGQVALDARALGGAR